MNEALANWIWNYSILRSQGDKTPGALPEKPASSPWLAGVLLGVHHDLGAAQWLGDFERCMVWLLLEDVFHDKE